MEARIGGISKDEVKRYLGIKNADVESELEDEIDKAIEIALGSCEPKLVYRQMPVSEAAFLSGNDIFSHIEGCDEIVVFAASAGAEIDRLIRRAQVTDISFAFILDCCGSALIENICDNFCFDLGVELSAKGKNMTSRFSPGYGDFPLESQRAVCMLLNTEKRAGIGVNEPEFSLTPSKSVTAVIGIGNCRSNTERKCDCNLKESCLYRKESCDE